MPGLPGLCCFLLTHVLNVIVVPTHVLNVVVVPTPANLVPGPSSVGCANWQSFVLIAGVRCLLCFLAGPGVWGFLGATHQQLDVESFEEKSQGVLCHNSQVSPSHMQGSCMR